MGALVLASSSPYRSALLTRLGVPFEIASPDIDETPAPGERAGSLVQRLARLKAEAGAAGRSDGLIIGCDQCAVRDEAIIGKPGSSEAAFRQLEQSSGKTLVFHTGLCLLDTDTGTYEVDEVRVTVKFRSLSKSQITAYLRKERPYNCAGSFMSEGLGIALIERLECEDPTALVGLPLIRLVSMLAKAGVQVL
jgi:septum formation protein